MRRIEGVLWFALALPPAVAGTEGDFEHRGRVDLRRVEVMERRSRIIPLPQPLTAAPPQEPRVEPVLCPRAVPAIVVVTPRLVNRAPARVDDDEADRAAALERLRLYALSHEREEAIVLPVALPVSSP